MKKRICIGIPCFQGVPAETLEDYMRFAFYLGRHYQDYDFFLAIKTKMEQFRARNEIVEAALSAGCDYVLMIDDDHVIDWEDKLNIEPNKKQDHYDFLKKLLKPFEEEKTGIVGALYYQRGGDCRPVVMKEGKDGGYYYLRDDEITNDIQEVAVTGGGCFLIDMNIFSRIPSPWFEKETRQGTDLQICEKARKEGFKVYCDTSVVLGHVMSKREVITPKNRHRISSENGAKMAIDEGIDPKWSANSALQLYREDAEEYSNIPFQNMQDFAYIYQEKYERFDKYSDPKEYYKTMGIEQLCRQVWFHHTPGMIEQQEIILNLINHNDTFDGLDFGCGSSPVGFELALRGQNMDFVDLDGAEAYEFTKWRAKKRNLKCGFKWKGSYDFILMLDSIEHIKDWKEILNKAEESLKPNGFIITNYFFNQDYENKEHISMDKESVKDYLIEKGLYPINELVWMKKDMTFMDRKEAV